MLRDCGLDASTNAAAAEAVKAVEAVRYTTKGYIFGPTQKQSLKPLKMGDLSFLLGGIFCELLS